MISSAPLMTWKFVRTRPRLSMMTPEPRPGRRNSERGRRALGAEELIEEILEERIVAAARRRARPAQPLGALDGAEVHDRRPHLLRDADEALLERLRDRRWARAWSSPPRQSTGPGRDNLA